MISYINNIIKLSIIVPVYNTEKYLTRCLDSIINQEFKNFEVIIVDDGSTDNSGEICDNYAEKDDRFKVIHKKNEGLLLARLDGVKKAKGNFIGFIDSDDWIDVQMYSSLLKPTDTDFNIDICVGGHVIDYSIGGATKPFILKKECRFSSIDALKIMFEGKLFGWAVTDKIYKKSLFDNLNIRDSNKSYGEDTAINWELFKNAHYIYYKPIWAYHYYINSDSMTQQNFSAVKLEYLDRLIFILKNINSDRIDLKKIIARQLIRYGTQFIIQMFCENDDNYVSAIKKYQVILRKYIPLAQDLITAREKYLYKKAQLKYVDGLIYIEQEKKNLYNKCVAFCNKCDNTYIYGTGTVSKAVASLLNRFNIQYEGFVVSNLYSNNNIYMGKKVFSFTNIKKRYNNCGFYLAVNERSKEEIIDLVEEGNRTFSYIDIGKYMMLEP